MSSKLDVELSVVQNLKDLGHFPIDESLKVNTHDWELVNGKKASGRGDWTFIFTKDYDAVDMQTYKHTDYKQALKAATQNALKLGAKEIDLVDAD